MAICLWKVCSCWEYERKKVASVREIKIYAERALINPRILKAMHILGKWRYMK